MGQGKGPSSHVWEKRGSSSNLVCDLFQLDAKNRSRGELLDLPAKFGPPFPEEGTWVSWFYLRCDPNQPGQYSPDNYSIGIKRAMCVHKFYIQSLVYMAGFMTFFQQLVARAYATGENIQARILYVNIMK